MKITVQKLTDYSLLQRAAWATSGREVKAPLVKWYDSEHSPMRTQLFWVEMIDIPSFVSTHLVRHDIGVEHFVRSNRDDRGGIPGADRETPVTHCMLINAQALVNMARKRMCQSAHKKAQLVIHDIAEGVLLVDPDLYGMMVPDCVYRNGCHDFKPCGYWEALKARESASNAL